MTSPTPPGSPRTRGAQKLSFLEFVRQRECGKLKFCIGSAAGVGKTYRMLQDRNELLRRSVDVVIEFVETHARGETVAKIGELELVPQRRIEYRGVIHENLDVDAIIARRL